MPTGPNSQQLREWYKKFSDVLKREADIDVNDINDLARVKNIQITRWDTTNPSTPEVTINYAYTPHNGNEPVNPYSPTANEKEHAAWLNENLKPAVTDEQILQLYNMSREGTLMISTVADGLKNIQMVHTERDGTIVTSLPARAYRYEKNDKLPEANRIPKQPEKPNFSLNPEDYGIAPRPVAPPEPANMNPSIWSMIAYFLFRVDNDYAKLQRYNLAKMDYDEAAANWDNEVEHAETRVEHDAETGQDRTIDYDEFRIARNAHELYSQQLTAYQLNADPLTKFGAIANSAEKLAKDGFWQREKLSVEGNYKNHPRGAAGLVLDDYKKMLDFEERTDTMLHNWLGHNADPVKTLQYVNFDLYGIQINPIVLPKSPDFGRMTQPEQAIHSKYMSDLFELAALSAMADPDLTVHEDKPGKTRKDTAENVFYHVLNDAITSGRPDLRGYYRHIEPTRQKALSVMTAYSRGEKGPLAELLGMGMRNLLKSGHKLGEFTRHAINTPYMIGKMYKMLHEDKDLLQASGLTAEELQDAEAHMELYKFMRQGIRAKVTLLEHAFGNRTLTPDHLQKAAGDMLMFNHVMLGLSGDYKENERAIYASPEYKRIEDSFMVPKDANDPSKGKTTVDAETFAMLKNQLDVLCDNFPPNKFIMGLLDKEGVRKYRQELLEKADFSKLSEMSREELRDLFVKNNGEIAAFLMPSPKQKTGDPASKDLQLEKQDPALTNNASQKQNNQIGIG